MQGTLCIYSVTKKNVRTTAEKNHFKLLKIVFKMEIFYKFLVSYVQFTFERNFIGIRNHHLSSLKVKFSLNESNPS